MKLSDNDFSSAGGEFIGTALKNNRVLKHLKIAENDLRISGIEKLLDYGIYLESLDISKNSIKQTEKLMTYIQ